MKDNTLTILIQKPVHEVFLWLLTPKTLPFGFPELFKKKRNEEPIRLGTVYRNRGESGKWNEYVITEFEEDRLFTFSSSDGNYACRYTFESLFENETALTYYEWIQQGEIEEPFTSQVLEKLKSALEG